MGLLDLHPQLVHYRKWLLDVSQQQGFGEEEVGTGIKTGCSLNTISLGPWLVPISSSK